MKPSTHQGEYSAELLGEGMQALMQHKGKPCLTILCPLHPSNPDRFSDRLALKHLVQEAILEIQKYWEATKAGKLISLLETTIDKIDLVHAPKGLGIYLTDDFIQVEHYSAAVPPIVQVEERFPIRESLWQLQLSRPVYVLCLSEHQIQLHQVSNGQWTEIRDHFFPYRMVDSYEYSKPVRSSSYAGHAHVKMFEPDKIEMQHIRLRDAFRRTEAPLSPYLMNGEPLVLAGPERDMSLFSQVSRHVNRVVGQINGNYQLAHRELFEDKVIQVIQENRRIQMNKQVSLFFEKWGSGLGKCGLLDCWKAVESGQGLRLLVERGYREPVYFSASGQFSAEKTQLAATWMPDAIDRLMEMTIEKGGEVLLVDNNLLGSAQRFALILRYS